MTKILITGATGYIGGDALEVIVDAHPEYEITALVRTPDKGASVAASYPKIRLVYGDLDSTDLLTTESAAADIVLHTADADHPGAANAIVKGLTGKDTAGFYIHTSGTGILGFNEAATGNYGQASEEVYDDWEGVAKVTSLPDEAAHRNVDKIVLAAGQSGIQTAIVCPPTIYGQGRGPGNQRSIQMPWLSQATLTRRTGVKINEHLNKWTMVHVQDLSKVYLSLVEAAAQSGGAATWGPEGYYFAENGEFVWGEVAAAVAKEAKKQGLIKKEELTAVTEEEKQSKLYSVGIYLWGTNSRCKAIRARKLLGWQPKEKSLWDLIPEVVELEAKSLGLIKDHAQVAAGN